MCRKDPKNCQITCFFKYRTKVRYLFSLRFVLINVEVSISFKKQQGLNGKQNCQIWYKSSLTMSSDLRAVAQNLCQIIKNNLRSSLGS